MAIVAISRQVAALGDEIAASAAEKLGYKFVRRQELEQRIVNLGFPAEKLYKYDEKKPKFFASLVKDRDEYLQYLQTAVLEAASEDNCILIGRGSYIILEDVQSLISFRLIANNSVRIERLEKEFSWTEKQARQRIDESDLNRRGFHKSFFNVELDDLTRFHLIMNTGIIGVEEGADIITSLVRTTITPERDAEGNKKLRTMLDAQHLVNKLVFDYKINIEFLRAVIDGKTVTLQGVADSSAVVERALKLTAETMPGYTAKSAVSIIQDFKAYP
ncbi:MAG: cytidylate kinase-like family protein [Treponema sp.]